MSQEQKDIVRNAPGQDSAETEARRWVVRLDSGSATDADHTACSAWRGEDSAHELAFQYVSDLWRSTEQLEYLKDSMPGPVVTAHSGPLKSLWNSITGAGVFALDGVRGPLMAASCLIILVVGFSLWPVMTGGGDLYSTAIGETRQVLLQDGSVTYLGAGSKVILKYAPRERRLVLEEGEAMFDVAHDPLRPFIVVADGTEVRAIGTKFNVHKGPGGTTVTVLEGRVHVARSGGLPDDAILAKDQQVNIEESGELSDVRRVVASSVTSWRVGRLIFEQSNLETVVADLNRYVDGTIYIADDGINGLPVTAIFNTGDFDAIIRALEQTGSVAVTRVTPYHVMLRARDSNG